MSPTSDPRRIVGSRIHTRARLVTSDSKCRRMYGAKWKVKKVSGTVRDVKKSKVNGRNVTDVNVSWQLADSVKVMSLRLASIKAGESPENDADTEISNCSSNL